MPAAVSSNVFGRGWDVDNRAQYREKNRNEAVFSLDFSSRYFTRVKAFLHSYLRP